MTNTTITLNNGIEIPAVGLGVFQTPADVTTAAVEEALRAGYRLIDTAAAYGNEREVGEGIRNSGVPREEVFVETKIWISDYGFDATLHSFEKSAGKLGVDYIDLVLLHQALPSAFDLTIEAYKALEQLLADGKVRAIGVSNFTTDNLEQLLAATTVVPAVNQIELHPYFQQKDVQAANAAHGILTQAWSPIGGVTTYTPGATSVLENETLKAIAAEHGKSVAQVMLAWHLAEGRAVVPKSTKAERIAENFALDFELTPDQLAAVDALETGVRGGPPPGFINLTDHAFPIPEA
ncbi:diketogulonate reductase-like aldo/keto reductase [Conyzicola lurida]|uniref:Diketogulonate reductase-like aldo/keto reductase n=1 Tax=Conyzicola lurida TaxID=1172621 RepID=A0A841ARV8_9MICO|nr:aldo/keto reductase [Conyzicola lurida]MBB5844682.1 diketogulonate reductase-like aldo/keto reductase [Conyzicola lurida]